MDYMIPQALAQDVLNYLQEQPYRSVAALIQALLRLEPVAGPEEVAPEPENRHNRSKD